MLFIFVKCFQRQLKYGCSVRFKSQIHIYSKIISSLKLVRFLCDIKRGNQKTIFHFILFFTTSKWFPVSYMLTSNPFNCANGKSLSTLDKVNSSVILLTTFLHLFIWSNNILIPVQLDLVNDFTILVKCVCTQSIDTFLNTIH